MDFTNSTTIMIVSVLGVLLLVLIAGGIGYAIGSRPNAGRGRKSKARSSPERERMRAIYRLSATMMSTLNYEMVLDIALDMSASVFGGKNGKASPLVSAVLLFDEDALVVKSARRFSKPDMRITIPAEQGKIAEAINQGTPALIMDPASDPELGQYIAIRSCKAAYCVPLRSGRDIYGILVFAHPGQEFFNKENREILDVIATQAINAMQNARLYQDLEMEKERMADAQEEARKKLARDLHDGPTQSVSAIAMRVNFARRLMERSPEEAADELYKIEDLARRTTKEIRHMLFTLRPLVLESQGLRAALEAMADKMKETYDQNVHIDIDDRVMDALDMGKLGVIFYITEEAVNNARKHANAPNIYVHLKPTRHEGISLLEIQDDGVGFDVEAVQSSYDSRGSLGMINLRERAELVSGVLQIQSSPGQGSKIQVWIPMTEAAAERLWHRK